MRKVTSLVLLAPGLTFLTVSTAKLAKDLPIWVFGQRCAAGIVETWVEQAGDDGGAASYQHYVRHEFTTRKGKIATGTSRVGPHEWAGLGMGGPVPAVHQEQSMIPSHGVFGLGFDRAVAIVYFPRYPAHDRLNGSRLAPVLARSYVPSVLLGCGSLLERPRLLRHR